MATDQQEVGITVVKEGTGEGAIKGQTVAVHYTGKLVDGTVFDSSIPRGKPFTLRLGGGEVIAGWEIGLIGMKVGEERTLTIPSHLGYGRSGYPGVIPPDAALIFDVTMVSINQ